MKKLSIPKVITILRRTYNSKIRSQDDGGIVTKLDSIKRKNNTGTFIFRDKWKYNGSVLANRALMQLNSTEYDNMKGYKPSIGMGFTGDKNNTSHYDWWFTAPDGVTKLSLSERAVGSLLTETTIKNGKIEENCIICKEGTEYLPIPKNNERIKVAYKSTFSYKNTKVKNITPGQYVSYRGIEFTYLGMYSMQVADNSSTKRMHVLFNFSTKQIIAKSYYGDEITVCDKTDKNYTKDNFSAELTTFGSNSFKYHWRADYCIFAKNSKDLLETLNTLAFERSSIQHELRYSDRGLIYHEGTFYRIEYSWNEDSLSLVPCEFNRTYGTVIDSEKKIKKLTCESSNMKTNFSHTKIIAKCEGVNIYCIINNKKIMLTKDKESTR